MSVVQIEPRKPKFKIGDKVTLINDYGCKFPERTVTGIDEIVAGNEIRYFFEPNGAHWYSAQESSLIADADDPVVAVIGEHKIRNMEIDGEKWFLVGTTGCLFSTIEAAEQHAGSQNDQNFTQGA